MEKTSISSCPRTIEEIFRDYSGRRSAVVRALTSDVDEFYSLCDPVKENLCLFGYPNETWQVTLPAEEVPPEIPEPSLGINFARDGMDRNLWLSLVAVHTDSWLLSVAFYYGARFNRNERKCLFNLINDLPTVFEAMTQWKPIKHEPSPPGGTKSRNITKKSSDGQSKSNLKLHDHNNEDEDEDEDEHGDTRCGTCGENYGEGEFWIGCDDCAMWFHGNCVKITPAMAENIKHYKCFPCSTKSSQ